MRGHHIATAVVLQWLEVAPCATPRSPGEGPDGMRKAAFIANNIAQLMETDAFDTKTNM